MHGDKLVNTLTPTPTLTPIIKILDYFIYIKGQIYWRLIKSHISYFHDYYDSHVFLFFDIFNRLECYF